VPLEKVLELADNAGEAVWRDRHVVDNGDWS
jgi:hypothetical protein